MPKTHKKPGLILIFDDEVWYQPVDDYHALKPEIDKIKYALVEPSNQDRVLKSAEKLDSKDTIGMTDVEKDDVKDLLTKGVTIRPLGR
jgi:hypothetical protein